MKKNFVEELKWRGMLAQMMPGTEELLQKEMVTCSATFSAADIALLSLLVVPQV